MVPPHQYFFIETPSLERLPTKAKQDPSPHEMRLSPAGHEPSIFWSQGNYYYYYYYNYYYYYYYCFKYAIIINIIGLYNKVQWQGLGVMAKLWLLR